jgi:hypothetical protein
MTAMDVFGDTSEAFERGENLDRVREDAALATTPLDEQGETGVGDDARVWTSCFKR